MKKSTIGIVVFLFCFQIAFHSYAQPVGLTNEGPHEKQGTERMELHFPEELWNEMKEKVSFESKSLGYTSDEMAHFENSKYILPKIKGLFRNVDAIPEYTGARASTFNKYAERGFILTAYGYIDLGWGAGHHFAVPEDEQNWGFDWIPNGSAPLDVIEILLQKEKSLPSLTSYDKNLFLLLPREVQKYIAKVLAASYETNTYLSWAFDKEFLAVLQDIDDMDADSMSALYSFASAPWNVFPVEPSSFQLIDSIDMAYASTANSLFFRFVDAANKELQIWLETEDAKNLSWLHSLQFSTPMGYVLISGTNDGIVTDSCSFIFELGGNDTYTQAGANRKPASCGFCADFSGNDLYGTEDISCAFGYGLFGIGSLFDFDGDDIYQGFESCFGSALYGTGFLLDFNGSDSYSCEGIWNQGSAMVGVGVLSDLHGDDTYYAGNQSQAYAGTLGFGSLVDHSGNDSYKASDSEEYYSSAFQDTISFCQGTAFGRRADYGDGHNMGGGIALLVEGEGDDTYYGNVYSQGAGYWWALGALEDLGGNDIHRCTWYSLGSAPHFAIGSCVDNSGNDAYNIGNDSVKCQFQGCARDGSIGIFIDGDGDDQYLFANRCAGAGDLNSIAVFWDRYGNDHYATKLDGPYGNDPPCGSSAVYEKFYSFRDRMKTVGIFLDTEGVDEYALDTSIKGTTPLLAKDNHEWYHNQGPIFWGYGLDLDWF